MFDKLRKTVGRKLVSVILAPILTTVLITVNSFLPEGSRLLPEQITEIVTYLIGLVGAFVVMQGAGDVTKEIKKKAIQPEQPCPPVTPATTPPVPSDYL